MAKTLTDYIIEKASKSRSGAKSKDRRISGSSSKSGSSTSASFLLNRNKKEKQIELSFTQELEQGLERISRQTEKIKTKVYQLGKMFADVTEQETAFSENINILNDLFSRRSMLEKTVFTAVAYKVSDFPEINISEERKTSKSIKPKEKEQNEEDLPPETISPPKQQKPPKVNPPKSPDKKSQGAIKPGVSKKKKKQSLVPYANIMKLPLQAAGIYSISVISNFIKSSGPMGGFFTPYINSMIKPFALALGVGESLFSNILVDISVMAEKKKSESLNDFIKTWSGFLKDDNFIDKFIDREAETTGTPLSGVGTDFWTLAAMCAVEDGRGQGNADVAQSVYNRIADGSYGKTIYDVITADGQYQVAYIDPTASRGPGTKTDEIWKSINDEQSAGAAICSYYKKRGQTKTIESCAAQAKKAGDDIRNTSYQKEAAAFVGGRTDYLANDPAGVQRPEGGNSFTWKYGKKYATGTPWSLTAAPVPAFSKGGSGKKAIMSSTPFVVSGPKSGFDYVLRDDIGRPYPVTLHGTELIDPQDDGFKVYPIQNRSYDVTKDPLALQKRWRDIAYNTGEKSTASYSSGGSAEFWKIAALASKEDSLHSQGQADVAQSLYNRAAIGSYPGGKSITSIIMAPGQYQPTFTNAGSWNAIRDRKSAIAAAGNAKKVDMAAASITNPSLQKAAQKFVGGRTDFMGESQKPYMKPGDITRGKNYNFHGWFYDAKLPNPAPVPKMVSSQTRSVATSNKKQGKIIVNNVGGKSSSPTISTSKSSSKTISAVSFDPLKFLRELTMRRSR